MVTFAVAANVWPVLLVTMGVKPAAMVEVVFLALFIAWARGAGPPRAAKAFRARAFRCASLTPTQWLWGLIAALCFAVTVHAAVYLLFRFVPYPSAAFRQGYDLSFVPSYAWRWVVVVISAASAAICEETGFRGFVQQPIEQRHGIATAVFVSSLLFMAVHLTKAWALLGMIPIVVGAGILLGLLAWSWSSLIPGIVGHFVMDVGLFAYWWTGIAGTFSARPITETGVDVPILIAGSVFAVSLAIVLLAMTRLRKAASNRAIPSIAGV
jgi:membrane protease YdiL (CAAX protease family)